MEKTDLDGQVTKLKLLKANHESQRYALEDKLIKYFPQAIKREKEMIADLEKTWPIWRPTRQPIRNISP